MDPVLHLLAGKSSLRSLHRAPAKLSLALLTAWHIYVFPSVLPMSVVGLLVERSGTYDLSILLNSLDDDSDECEDSGSGRTRSLSPLVSRASQRG